MKKIVFLIITFGLINTTFSQTGSVGIGTTTPDNSAVLDVQSTDKGMLIPRMTTSQRTSISNAAKGLLVFDNTTGTFWFYNGNAWTELTGGGSSGQWTPNANHIYNSNTGNVGIGTTAPNFKLDVQGRMRLKAGTPGNVNTSAGIWFDDYRDGSNQFFFGMKDSIRGGFYGSGNGVGWNLLFNTKTGRFNDEFNMDGNIKLFNGNLNFYDGVTNNFSGYIAPDSNDIYINAKRSSFSNLNGNLLLQVGDPRPTPPILAGNVGIGVSNPIQKLDVDGNIRVSGEILRAGLGTNNMMPIAYGVVGIDGTILIGTGNFTVILNNIMLIGPPSGDATIYVIDITGVSLNENNAVIQVTPIGNYPKYAVVRPHTDNLGDFEILFNYDGDSWPPCQFSFVVYKP